MFVGYATTIQVILLIVAGALVYRTSESPNLMVDQFTAVAIRQPLAKVTDLSFVALDEEIPHCTPNNQELYLSRPMRTEHGTTSTHQSSQACNSKSNPAPQKDW